AKVYWPSVRLKESRVARQFYPANLKSPEVAPFFSLGTMTTTRYDSFTLGDTFCLFFTLGDTLWLEDTLLGQVKYRGFNSGRQIILLKGNPMAKSKLMDEMCMVMCGAWLCGSDGKWEFVVDKTNMARMIPVHEALTINEIESLVFSEFQKSKTSFNLALSYWPPDSKDLATGIKTPPVLLTSDGALRYFFAHMKVTGSLNLFVTFECLGYGTAAPDMDAFVTPKCSTKQRESGTKRKNVDIASVGSKTNFIDLDDFHLIEEVEKFEERLRSESNPTGGGDCSGWSEGIESDYSGPEEIDERDIRPRGYDVEFWEPLIDGDLGGSNAVEVVFNEKEANGVAKLSEDSRSEPAGGSSSGSDVKGEIPGPKKKTVPNKCGRCRVEGHNRTNCTVPI
ncbi:hypothetical protein HID58_001349, partial [Brassica napus]